MAKVVRELKKNQVVKEEDDIGCGADYYYPAQVRVKKVPGYAELPSEDKQGVEDA